MLWTLVGLRLFSGQGPTWNEARAEVTALLAWTCYARSKGNVTRMAAWLGSSRRAVRRVLQDIGARPTEIPVEAPEASGKGRCSW